MICAGLEITRMWLQDGLGNDQHMRAHACIVHIICGDIGLGLDSESWLLYKDINIVTVYFVKNTYELKLSVHYITQMNRKLRKYM